MTSPCRTCGAVPSARMVPGTLTRKDDFGNRSTERVERWFVECPNFACTERACAVGRTREAAEADWDALQSRRRDNPMIGDNQR